MAEEEVVKEKIVEKEVKGRLSVIHLVILGVGIIIIIALLFWFFNKRIQDSVLGLGKEIKKQEKGTYRNVNIQSLPEEGEVFTISTQKEPFVATLKDGTNVAMGIDIITNTKVAEAQKALFYSKVLHVCNIYFNGLTKADFQPPSQATSIKGPEKAEKSESETLEEEWEEEESFAETEEITIKEDVIEKHRRELTRILRDSAKLKIVEDVLFTSMVVTTM